MGQGGAGAATTGDGEKGALPSLKQVAERTSHSELAMSPSLLAFNRYQQQQREEHLGVRDPQLTESIASSSRGLDGILG